MKKYDEMLAEFVKQRKLYLKRLKRWLKPKSKNFVGGQNVKD